MKNIAYIIFFLWTVQTLNAQGWHQFYDEYPSSTAQEIIQLPDDNYVIAGLVNPGITNKFFLAKIGTDGAVMNMKMDFDISMTNIGNILLNPEGELIVLGSKMNATQDLVVLKFDAALDLKWAMDLPSLGYKEEARNLILGNDGSYLVHGVSYKNAGFIPVFAKLNENGGIIWHKEGNELKESLGMTLDIAGNIVSTGRTLSEEKVFVSVYDQETGDEIDFVSFNYDLDEKETGYELMRADAHYLFIVSRYEKFDPVTSELIDAELRVRKIDTQGNVLLQKSLGKNLSKEEYIRMIRQEDGTFTYCFRSSEDADRYYIQVVHLDSDLTTELWSKEFIDISPNMELAYDFISTKDGGYMVSGAVYTDTYIPLLVKLDRNGVAFSNKISGTVFHDQDKDCAYDDTEPPLSDWMVEIKGENEVFYRMVDENGNFSLSVDKGDYMVRAVPPSDVWQECPVIHTSFDDYFQDQTVYAPARALFDCPVLSADISIGNIRRCYERTYAVDYCNLGTEDASDVYIEVEIDSQLLITNTSIPVASQEGNKLTFNIGNLPYNECGSFLVTIYTPCEVDLGDIHCSTVHIYPDVICEDAEAWSGAKVKVVGECMENNEIIFEIKNIGESDMDGPLNFHVIEDEMVLMTGTFDLDIGESHPVTVLAEGGVYRLEAEQVPDYPGESSPSVIVPGCGGFFDNDYMSWYPMDDDELFYDISCMENEDSYDPNDKRASPVGYDVEHFIEKNTDLEYLIRFQNTGTGEAYEVEIVDPISDVLDISTFRMGTSSHPCEVEINDVDGKHVLRFIFKDINLAPMIEDEAASIGFVKFTIGQVEDLPVGTVIENEAHIYFDFNEAIITNIAKHTIGENFIVGIASDGAGQEQILNITVSPNPFVKEAIVKWNDMDDVPVFLDLYSSDGRLVQRNSFMNNQVLIKREDLSPGMYFYSVMTVNGKKHNGKMMVRN